LINNAGVWILRAEMSKDGMEIMLAVNTIAPFLLMKLLRDMLLKAGKARIINVSSFAHAFKKLDLRYIKGERIRRGFSAYGQSKLALIMLSYRFADMMKGKGVAVNCLHPGVFASYLGRGYGFIVPYLMKLVLRSPEKASDTPFYLATSDDVEGVTGKYFVNKRPVKSSKESHNREKQELVWEACKGLTRNYL
ncbi:SDR family NAD(P)-dependent oxidoreductase, partial [Spirochaetota bacterium]